MDKRVRFDFEIDFTNGGGLQGQDFRLDLAGDDISDRELADCLVRDMRLLMVGEVRIRNKVVFEEKHKRQAPQARPQGPAYLDLSHDIEAGMVSFRGLPGPVITDFLSRERSRERYAPGVEFHIGRIEMVANTGTYLDSPFHRYAEGADLAGLDLANLVDLAGLVVRVDHRQTLAIDASFFRDREIRGRAVLVQTGWDAYWGTDRYQENNPYLTAAAAAYLSRCGVGLVGIDSVNIDDAGDKTRPVHSLLLAAGIPILEHLRGLDRLPEEGFTLTALPPKIKGLGSFPVRAVARIG
jgi:kynurenine formamidase